MPDIIQLLPDSVANQIAAGEVIQRPASVVKELSENAIDAGANMINIVIKDAGKTLIQIIDNGCGMSETDARLAFERHATSKIRKAEDLFAIHTMGFRGEALASIAAISHVDLKTKKYEDDLGTYLQIEGSEVKKQESVSCSAGCNFSVKNLFFNVPARRKFLKATSTELRHIIDEVHRLALANASIAFTLIHNGAEIFNLPPSNTRQRIVNIFGKSINQNLVSIETDTSIVRLEGFIGKPEFAKKTRGQQFFFVNNRFMKHPYFYKAIIDAYSNLLPPETTPSFFIYFSIEPENIDINIHPTKTEIKFEDERSIWQIIQASAKEALGKFNIVPSIDFDMEQGVEIPVLTKNTDVKQPEIKINPDYNPFDADTNFSYRDNNKSTKHWESLYSGMKNTEERGSNSTKEVELENIFENTGNRFFQYKNKYLFTPVKSGLMIVDQRRAYERIHYEKYLMSIKTDKCISQRTLFPKTIELNQSDSVLLKEIIEDLCVLGFDIDEFGKNTFIINGTPDGILIEGIEDVIDGILERYKNLDVNIEKDIKEQIAVALSSAASANYNKSLSSNEMQELIDGLFACNAPNYTADGKLIVSIMQNDELEKRFK